MYNERDAPGHRAHRVVCPALVNSLVRGENSPDVERALLGALHHRPVLLGPGEGGPGVAAHLALQADVVALPGGDVLGVREEERLNCNIFTSNSAGIIIVIAVEHNRSLKLGTIAHKNAVSFSGTISFMIVKYPLTVNGESRNVRVPGTH